MTSTVSGVSVSYFSCEVNSDTHSSIFKECTRSCQCKLSLSSNLKSFRFCVIFVTQCNVVNLRSKHMAIVILQQVISTLSIPEIAYHGQLLMSVLRELGYLSVAEAKPVAGSQQPNNLTQATPTQVNAATQPGLSMSLCLF